MNLVDRGLLCTALLLASASLSCGYGAGGHRFVGALAEDVLKTDSRSADPEVARRAKETLERARQLLHGMTFAQASVIPDEIKAWDPDGRYADHPDRLAEARHWPKKLTADLRRYFEANSDQASGKYHHAYHYVDIPITPTAVGVYAPGAVGTARYDIVETLHTCEGILRSGGQAEDGRVIPEDVALVLLIHMTGDLHQPLHVGAEYFDANGDPAMPSRAQLASGEILSDEGGNGLGAPTSVTPLYHGRRGSLHYVWDSEIPKRAFEVWQASLGADSDRAEALAGLLAVKPAPAGCVPTSYDAKNLSAVWVAWANEILPMAQEAHAHFVVPVNPVHGEKAGVFEGELQLKNGRENYDDAEVPVVQQELLKAGWRLAWVMEDVLAPRGR